MDKDALKQRAIDGIIKKYGSYEKYKKEHSKEIKEGMKNRTDTLQYYLSIINKDEFIDLYINQNKPRTFLRSKYGISDYMMDRLVESFNCHKNKKQSAIIGLDTKRNLYPSDNINNWKKGHETRIKNSGSLKESYSKGLEKQKQTMLKKYGCECLFTSPSIDNFRKKSDTRPNIEFENKLKNNHIKYEKEFVIGSKMFDFKVGDKLIEINPTVTHNIFWSPYGEHKGLDYYYHRDKSKLAENNNYQCIQAWDWEDKNKLINLLKPRNRIYARNCEIYEVSKDVAKDYIEQYHLQGSAKDDVRVGLYYKKILVSIMTFGKPRYNKNYEWELVRFCSHFQVVGGAEKLFTYFRNRYKPKSIISYCDKSKFIGKVYTNLGFTFKNISYNKHWHNIKTGKHITDNLLRQRGFDQLLGKEYGCYGKGTDNEQLMLQHGFLPVVDCGQASYIWTATN